MPGTDAPPSLAEALDDLAADIATRRMADPATSYTARLFAGGPRLIAKKLGEEGVETALALACQDDQAVVSEAADLLYHLMVGLAARAISPSAVARALTARRGVSGLAEKAARSGEA